MSQKVEDLGQDLKQEKLSATVYQDVLILYRDYSSVHTLNIIEGEIQQTQRLIKTFYWQICLKA